MLRAPQGLLCLFILPLKRPAVPLIVGGKWNKALLLTWYRSLSRLPKPEPGAPANHHRFACGGTHHASVMAIIHFAEAILGTSEAAWKLPVKTARKAAFSSSLWNRILCQHSNTMLSLINTYIFSCTSGNMRPYLLIQISLREGW